MDAIGQPTEGTEARGRQRECEIARGDVGTIIIFDLAGSSVLASKSPRGGTDSAGCSNTTAVPRLGAVFALVIDRSDEEAEEPIVTGSGGQELQAAALRRTIKVRQRRGGGYKGGRGGHGGVAVQESAATAGGGAAEAA